MLAHLSGAGMRSRLILAIAVLLVASRAHPQTLPIVSYGGASCEWSSSSSLPKPACLAGDLIGFGIVSIPIGPSSWSCPGGIVYGSSRCVFPTPGTYFPTGVLVNPNLPPLRRTLQLEIVTDRTPRTWRDRLL